MEHKVYVADCVVDDAENRIVNPSRVQAVISAQGTIRNLTQDALASSPILYAVVEKFEAIKTGLQPLVSTSDAAGPSTVAGHPSSTPPVNNEDKEEERYEDEEDKEEDEEEKEEDEDEEDEDDDVPDDQSESESSADDDDNDAANVLPFARKPQTQGEAFVPPLASQSAEVPSSSQSSDPLDAARLQQFEEARRLRLLEAGEDVSEDSVSIHTEYSSEDETSLPSISAAPPSDLQLMVIPQSSSLPPQLSSVPEAIQFFQ